VKLKNLINFETHAIPDLKFQMRYYESYFQRSIAPKRITYLERFFVLPPSHLNQRGSLTGTAKVQACWARSPFNTNALTRFSAPVREAASGKNLLRKCVEVFPSILPNSRCP
jgi:hypothetical protein